MRLRPVVDIRVTFEAKDVQDMAGTSTILIVREDLSIPGHGLDPSGPDGLGNAAGAAERRFFELLRENRPDVVVLDVTLGAGNGIDAIRKIRERSGVPILVVHAADDQQVTDYRIAGAADCIPAPIEILRLNRAIQDIIRVTGRASAEAMRQPDALTFAGLTYRPDQNALSGPGGTRIKLTTSENDLLSHFLGRARTVCTRAEIASILYGRHRPTSDRAIDVVVNRLRKKLVSVLGPDAEHVVKTEFRRGYMLVADVAAVPELQVAGIGAAE